MQRTMQRIGFSRLSKTGISYSFHFVRLIACELEMSILFDSSKFIQGPANETCGPNISESSRTVAMPVSVTPTIQQTRKQAEAVSSLPPYCINPSIFAITSEAKENSLVSSSNLFGIEPDALHRSDMSYLRQTLPLPSVSFIADPSHSHHDADGKTDQILAKDLIKVFKRNFDSLEVGQQSCGSAASAASLAHLQQLSRSFCAHPASTARADMCSEMPRLPLLGNAEHDLQTAAGPVTSTAMPTAMSAHETEVLRRAHLLVWEVAAQVAAGGGAAAAAAVMAATLGRDGRLRFRPPAAQPSA